MMGKDLELQVLGFFSFSFIFFLLWTFLFGHQEMELMSRPLTFGDQQLSRDEDRIPFPFPFFLFLVPRPLVGLEVFLG